MTEIDDIENSINAEALCITFGSTVIEQDRLIAEAARVLLSEYKPLTLEYSNNDQANYATCLITHYPARRLAL